MKIIATFLLKVLVKQFYIINAGFLLFIFFFFFGMVNGGQLIAYHKSLISALLSSPFFMGVVWLAWLLYNIKCILFCINTIKASDGNYIYTLRSLSSPKQFMLYLLIGTLQYMPVLAYSLFVIGMAIDKSMLSTALLVAAYQLLMIIISALVIFITINKKSTAPKFEKIITAITSWRIMQLGYVGFLPAYILHEKKIAFALVKIFSLLMLSVSFIINGDHFDEDLFSIFFLLIFVGHAALVFYCVDFAETTFQFSRNLPIALYKIGGMYLFTYAIFLLPEGAFMLINNNGNLPLTNIILLYLTSVSTLFLCTAILYGCGLNMESYLFFVFTLFLLIFFLQKTGMKLLTMLGILLTAIVVFKSYYHLIIFTNNSIPLLDAIEL
jgi:hypothetical protein